MLIEKHVQYLGKKLLHTYDVFHTCYMNGDFEGQKGGVYIYFSIFFVIFMN